MIPAVAVIGAWLLFGGAHLLLSWPPLRDALSQRLGTTMFVGIYTFIAAVSLTILGVTIARYGGDGSAGPDLAASSAGKWSLGAVAMLGALLMMAGLANFSHSPMAVLSRRLGASREARGKPLHPPALIEKVSRHPFFVGIAVLMGAHALMASTLPGALFFCGFVLLAVIGIPMQDRKLQARHGQVYAAHLEATSVVPFTTAKSPPGSQPQRVWPVLGIAIAGAVVLAALHPIWSLNHGAWFAVIVAVGGLARVMKTLVEIRKI